MTACLFLQAKEYETLLERLRAREELIYGNLDGPEIDIDDITFLAKDVWRGKSARAAAGDAGKHKALCRSVDGLTFTRCVPEAVRIGGESCIRWMCNVVML